MTITFFFKKDCEITVYSLFHMQLTSVEKKVQLKEKRKQ